MKEFNYYFLATFLFCACSNANITWSYNGQIKKGNSVLQSELAEISFSVATGKGVILAGYKKNKESVYFPYTAYVDDTLEPIKYWSENSDVQEFFQYKGQIYKLSKDGTTKAFIDQEWHSSIYTFKPNSSVIHTQEDIIACQPRDVFKEFTYKGNCYSREYSWVIDINWNSIKPEVCGNYLIAAELKNKKHLIHKITLNEGKVIQTLNKQVSGSLCTIFND